MLFCVVRELHDEHVAVDPYTHFDAQYLFNTAIEGTESVIVTSRTSRSPEAYLADDGTPKVRWAEHETLSHDWGEWCSVGSNHQREVKYVLSGAEKELWTREVEIPIWLVKIDDMETLQRLCDGRCSIHTERYLHASIKSDQVIWTIEIYSESEVE